MLGVECVEAGLLVGGEIGGFSLEFTQAVSVSVGEIDRDRNPFPAFGGDRPGLGLEFFGDKTIEQSNILKPTAVVVFEQVSQNSATSLFVCIEPNEARTAIGRANCIFGEHPPNLIRLIVAGAVDVLPDLFLSCVVGRDRERHELLQGHAIFGIDLVEF